MVSSVRSNALAHQVWFTTRLDRSQDWKERRRYLRYLIVRFLKAGLCFIISDGWGRNAHPHSHSCHSAIPGGYVQNYSLSVECMLPSPAPGIGALNCILFTILHAINFSRCPTLSARHHPTVKWASPVGPFLSLCAICWILARSVPANVTHTPPRCPKLLGVQKCYRWDKLLW